MNAVVEKLPTRGNFSEQLNSVFHARLDDGSVIDLSLVGSEPGVSTADYENFSLLFRAPLDTPPVQNMYRLENERLGSMDIFLVPIKKDDEGLYFEAVFSRFVAQ